MASSLSIYATRLCPGNDLLQTLQDFVLSKGLRAAFIVTCVGSLTKATLRFANQRGPAVREGHFEIVSLVGTISAAGVGHVHASLSDSDGVVFGGHVLPGCIIYTTAELVVGEATGLVFSRPVDPETTYDELAVDAR
jgi:uncharacterized protein